MIVFVGAAILGLAAIAVALWKYGFVHEAEHPIVTPEKSVIDMRERKAIFKRILRWREEGKITRAEYEHLLQLCEEDW